MDAHIAITEIHYGKEPGQPGDKSKGIPPKRPVTGVIKAGTVFVPESEEQRVEFVNAGAARPFDGDVPHDMLVLGEYDADSRNAIVSGPGATGGKRAETAAARKAAADEKGLAALREEFEKVVGEKPHANMKAETMQRRIEEVQNEKDKGGPGKEDGAPNASGSPNVAESSMGDTSAPAAEQTNPEGSTPKSGKRTGNNSTGEGDDENLV